LPAAVTPRPLTRADLDWIVDGLVQWLKPFTEKMRAWSRPTRIYRLASSNSKRNARLMRLIMWNVDRILEDRRELLCEIDLLMWPIIWDTVEVFERRFGAIPQIAGDLAD
jgi:hypothetical protein